MIYLFTYRGKEGRGWVPQLSHFPSDPWWWILSYFKRWSGRISSILLQPRERGERMIDRKSSLVLVRKFYRFKIKNFLDSTSVSVLLCYPLWTVNFFFNNVCTNYFMLHFHELFQCRISLTSFGQSKNNFDLNIETK